MGYASCRIVSFHISGHCRSWLSHLKIQHRLATRLRHIRRLRHTTINIVINRMRTIRNPVREIREKQIKIKLIPILQFSLKDPHRIIRIHMLGRRWDLVQRRDTRRRDSNITRTQIRIILASMGGQRKSRWARMPFCRGLGRGLAGVATLLQELSALLCELIGGRKEFDARSDVVDQRLDIFGDVIGVAGGHHATCAAVLVFVVLGVQEFFDLAG